MPTIDDFICPKEWVSEFMIEVGKMVRKWGEERYVPIRQQVDDDWRDHELIEPLLKEALVDLGLNKGMFPAEVGGANSSGRRDRRLHHRTGTGPDRFGLCHGLSLLHLGNHAGHPRASPQHGDLHGVRAQVLRPGTLRGLPRHDRAGERCGHRKRRPDAGPDHPDHRHPGRGRMGDQRPQDLAHQLRQAGGSLHRGLHDPKRAPPTRTTSPSSSCLRTPKASRSEIRIRNAA